MTKKKLQILVITLCLIVIGSSIGVYFYLKYCTTIIGWTEFQDDFYNYSVKYPKDWFIYPNEIHQSGYSTDITSFDLSQYTEEDAEWPTIKNELSIHIVIEDFQSNLSLEEWLKNNNPPIGNVISQKEITIGGLKGIEQTIDELGKMVYLPKEDIIFIIQAEPLESLEKRYNKTFNLILSTFKFTE